MSQSTVAQDTVTQNKIVQNEISQDTTTKNLSGTDSSTPQNTAVQNVIVENTVPQDTIAQSKVQQITPETSTQTPGVAQKVVEAIRSRIEASGRKMAEVKYSYSWYLNPPAGITYTPEPTGFSMAQELQFRLRGKVGEKVTVNVDYDDTQKKKQKISVIYSGEPEGRSGIQDVQFGDITLSLPGTEFVAYNKQLFGLSIKGQYKKFKFDFIGSQSKGYSETKEFRGKSTQQVKDIWDTNYYKMKYYTLGRHINSGKEKIYIDDKNAVNNTANTIYCSFTDPVGPISGYFDPQYTGIDYNINYGATSADTTIIAFIRSVDSNFVIIVYDIEANGGAGETYAIKDEFNSETRTNKYELKNYYYLGNRSIIPKEQDVNFVLEVRNPDNTVDSIITLAPTSQISGVKYYGVVDYDFGTLRLTDPTGKVDLKPFNSDAYLLTNSIHNYTIHTEYKSRIKIFLLRPNIVEESEKVYLDGRLLSKDVDYTIDYESGWFSFVREDDIKEESYIKIDYEYMPFGGQYVETVVGMRGVLPLSDDFSIGSTYLFSGTPSPDEIPNIRSTPQSHQIIDVDSQMRPLSLLSKLLPGVAQIPVTMNIAGEAAYSWKDPNTFGRAMIEDMEGIKLSVDMPVDMYSWRISSAPDGETQAGRGSYTLENKSEGHDPNSTSGNSLLINYTISDTWVAICYPISRYAQDYSQYNAVEFWVKSPPSDIKFFIDFGIISEDADGRGGFSSDTGAWKAGQPKTEDVNADGKLNPGEDVGWKFIDANGNIVSIGAGNNRLDGEDLDGDGILNAVNQKIHTFGGSFSDLNTACLMATSGDWKLYRIPFAQQISGDTDWSMVKHVRVVVKNPGGGTKTGIIQFDAISIVGNKWTSISISDTTGANTFTVEARNTKDNPEYVSPRDYIGTSDDDKDGDGINDYFEDLHPSLETQYSGLSKSLWPKEQSMALIYRFNTSGQASATQKFTRAMNFNDYRELKFWIYPTANSSGGTLILRFGMDDTTGYEYKMTVDSSMENKWTLKTIDIKTLSGLTKLSSTTIEDREILYNIKQITIGISDTGTSNANKEIWFDELHLDGVQVKEGYAWKVALSSDIAGGFLNLGYNRKQITHTFSTVGVATPAEDYDYQGLNGTLLLSRLMPAQWGISLPLGASWSRTRTYLEPSSAPDVPQNKLGERSQESQNYNLQFSRASLPSLSGAYGKSDLYSNFKGAEQFEMYQNYSGSTSYGWTFPKRLFFIIPTGHSLSTSTNYSISGDKREVRPAPSSETVTYTQNQTHDFGLSLTSQPIPDLTLNPSYSIRQTNQEQRSNSPLTNTFKPISCNQGIRIGCGTSLINGVSPGISFDENISENFFSVIETLRKNVTASASFNVNANVSPEKWHNALKFFNFYNSFNIGINTAYDDLNQSIDFWNITSDVWEVFKDLRKAISPISGNRKTASNKKSYSLNSNLYLWDPLSTSTNFSWGQDESQNQGSFTQVNNLAFGGNARLDLSQAFPVFKKISQSSYFIGSYSHRIQETANVSRTTSINPACSWQVRWNSDFNQYYSANYTLDTEERWAYLKNTSILSPSVKTDYNFRFPISFKIPFLNPIVLTNSLDLTNTTGAEFKRVKEDNKTERTNKVNSSLGLTYNVAENLLTTFSFAFTYFNNMDDYTKDYIAISLALRGVIRF